MTQRQFLKGDRVVTRDTNEEGVIMHMWSDDEHADVLLDAVAPGDDRVQLIRLEHLQPLKNFQMTLFDVL